MNKENQKVWLVTGTSKGLGLHLTKLLLSLGRILIATSRNTDVLEREIVSNKENLYPVKLDITSDKDVKWPILWKTALNYYNPSGTENIVPIQYGG